MSVGLQRSVRSAFSATGEVKAMPDQRGCEGSEYRVVLDQGKSQIGAGFGVTFLLQIPSSSVSLLSCSLLEKPHFQVFCAP